MELFFSAASLQIYTIEHLHNGRHWMHLSLNLLRGRDWEASRGSQLDLSDIPLNLAWSIVACSSAGWYTCVALIITITTQQADLSELLIYFKSTLAQWQV